jgi:hypothetical protein
MYLLTKIKIYKLKAISILSISFLPFLLSADMSPESSYDYSVAEKIKGVASSVLVEPGKKKTLYSPEKAMDGKAETFWCEGKEDDGIGETLELKWKPTVIEGFMIGNGVLLSKKYHELNNRIKGYEITILYSTGRTETQTGSFGDYSCSDSCNEQRLDGNALEECQTENKNKCFFERISQSAFAGGVDIGLDEAKCVTGVKIKILSVFSGSKFKDTCISDISLKMPSSYVDDDKTKRLKALIKSCK